MLHVVEHVVCFQLKPDVTPDQEAKFVEMLRGLKDGIPEIVDLTAGKTFTPERGKGYSIGLVVRFRDKEGLAVYGPHPHHQPVVQMVRQICDNVLAIDYEF